MKKIVTLAAALVATVIAAPVAAQNNLSGQYGFHSTAIQSACGGNGGRCLNLESAVTKSGNYWSFTYESNPPREGPIVSALTTLYGANTTVTTLKKGGQTTQTQTTPTIDAISNGSWVIKYSATSCDRADSGIGHQIGFPVSISHGGLAYPGDPHCLAVFAVGTQSNGGKPFAWVTFVPPN